VFFYCSVIYFTVVNSWRLTVRAAWRRADTNRFSASGSASFSTAQTAGGGHAEVAACYDQTSVLLWSLTKTVKHCHHRDSSVRPTASASEHSVALARSARRISRGVGMFLISELWRFGAETWHRTRDVWHTGTTGADPGLVVEERYSLYLKYSTCGAFWAHLSSSVSWFKCDLICLCCLVFLVSKLYTLVGMLHVCGKRSGSGLARTRPSGLRASAEVATEPSWRNISLGTTWTLETAEITSLFNERWAGLVELILVV